MQFRIELLHEERWAMKSACFTGHRALKGDQRILSERLYGYIQVRLSDEEYEAFNRKFNASGMKSRSDFFRHMIFTGYIVIFNDDKMNELLKLARSISNNFNQVAVRANSGGKVYPEDISVLREEVDKLWQPLRFFQSQLMSLHH